MVNLTDAMDLISTLKCMDDCYVRWDTDASHRLSMGFWSTADGQLLAQQYGDPVIQDNTGQTNV